MKTDYGMLDVFCCGTDKYVPKQCCAYGLCGKCKANTHAKMFENRDELISIDPNIDVTYECIETIKRTTNKGKKATENVLESNSVK